MVGDRRQLARSPRYVPGVSQLHLSKRHAQRTTLAPRGPPGSSRGGQQRWLRRFGTGGDRQAPVESRQLLSASHFSRPWIRIRFLRRQEKVMSVERDGSGFVALVRKIVSDGNAVFASSHRVGFSGDGVSWSFRMLDETPGTWFAQVAYAGGLYVAVGWPDLMRISTDGLSWTPIAVRARVQPSGLGKVVHLNNRFFAMGLSEVCWSRRMGGPGPIAAKSKRSSTTWRTAVASTWPLATDRSGARRMLPLGRRFHSPARRGETCPGVTAPDWKPGEPAVTMARRAFFAADKFWAGRFVSTDGRQWVATTSASPPTPSSTGSCSASPPMVPFWDRPTATTGISARHQNNPIPGASCTTAALCFPQTATSSWCPATPDAAFGNSPRHLQGISRTFRLGTRG